MRKVYVLNCGCIGDRCIIAVFSSKKKAREAKEWIIKNVRYYTSYPCDLYIDVFVLNDETDFKQL